MNSTQGLSQDLQNSINHQFHTVPTEPRDLLDQNNHTLNTVVDDYQYEILPYVAENRSSKCGRLKAKLEDFTRELKQNQSSKKSRMSQQSTPGSNYNSRKSLQSRVVSNNNPAMNFENSQNITRQNVKNGTNAINLDSSYQNESETRIVQQVNHGLRLQQEMSLMIMPNTPPNQEQSYSHFRSIDGIIQNPTQHPSLYFPSSGSNTQPFLFNQQQPSGVTTGAVHNSRLLPAFNARDELVSLIDSQDNIMQDEDLLNLSKTDEGCMQSAASLVNQRKVESYQVAVPHILVSNASSEQLMMNLMPQVITPQNENLARNKVQQLRQQLEEIKRRQEEQSILLGGVQTLDTQEQYDEVNDHISSLKELSYMDQVNNNDEYSNVKKVSISRIPQHFETPVHHSNSHAKIVASQILKNYNTQQHDLNEGTFGMEKHYQTYQEKEDHCDSQYQRDEMQFEEGRCHTNNDRFKSLKIQSGQTNINHYASVQTASSGQVGNKFNLLKNLIENSYSAKNKNNHYTTINSVATNSISVQQLQQPHVIPSQDDSEECTRLRQMIKVMQDNEMRMQAKMEDMTRKQERERQKWESQMAHMQTEVSQLNEIIGDMTSEKTQNARNPLRCGCRPRIKDLEKQILFLHKQMYFLRRGEIQVQSENLNTTNVVQSGAPPVIQVLDSIIKDYQTIQEPIRPSARDITPKPESALKKKIVKSRSTSGKKRASSQPKKVQKQIVMNNKTLSNLIAAVQTPKEQSVKSKIPESFYKRGSTPKGSSVKNKERFRRPV